MGRVRQFLAASRELSREPQILEHGAPQLQGSLLIGT
jgi:hypothetical protein